MHGLRPRILEPGELFADGLGVRLDEQGMRRKGSELLEVGARGRNVRPPRGCARARPSSSSGSTAGRAGTRGSGPPRSRRALARRPPRAGASTSWRPARRRRGPRPAGGFSTPAACFSVSRRIGEPPPIEAYRALRRLPASARAIAPATALRTKARAGCGGRRDPRRADRESPERPRGSQARRAGGTEPPAGHASERPGEDRLLGGLAEVRVEGHREVAEKDPSERRRADLAGHRSSTRPSSTQGARASSAVAN